MEAFECHCSKRLQNTRMNINLSPSSHKPVLRFGASAPNREHQPRYTNKLVLRCGHYCHIYHFFKSKANPLEVDHTPSHGRKHTGLQHISISHQLCSSAATHYRLHYSPTTINPNSSAIKKWYDSTHKTTTN